MSDKRDPFEILDPTILTRSEQNCTGSTKDRADMVKNPHTPEAILDGKRAIEVAAERISLREIKGMDGASFGLPKNKLPIIALNVISTKTGNVIDPEFRLTGIFDFVTEDEERDPEILKQYRLTEEGREKYMVEGQISAREKAG